jgi:hypothetical protein
MSWHIRVMSIDLIYSSINLKILTNISKYVTSHIKCNTDTSDKNKYLNSIILGVYEKYHKIPDNIGTLRKLKHHKTQFCWICGNSISNNMIIRTLPCQHLFHKRCIDKWLIYNNFKCAQCSECISVQTVS